MAYFLVAMDRRMAAVPINKPVLLVGRHDDCDIILTESKKISRRHCCVCQVDQRYLVRDLGSMNGVYLNGKRITREAPLKLGDELTVGDVRFRIEQPTADSESQPQPAAANGGKSRGTANGSAAASPNPTPTRGPQRPTPAAPPSLDFPVAVEDFGEEFVVEPSLAVPAPAAKPGAGMGQSGPLVELADIDDLGDEFELVEDE